jgi:hypothetical protein
MASLEGFNPAEVEPSAPIELLPAGDYPVILIETDLAKKDSGAVQFEFCVQITEGQFQNRRVYASQNYTKKDGSPNNIGRGQVSQICRCVGVMNPTDTTELHHKRLIAKVGVEKSEGYDPKNNVKGFKPYQQAPQAAQPATTQQAAPAGPSAWAQTVG